MKDIFSALADKNRRLIVQLLSEKEQCVNDLLKSFKIRQATLSAHLKYLLVIDLVKVKKINKKRIYSLNTDRLKQYLEELIESLKIDLDKSKNGDIADISGMLRK